MIYRSAIILAVLLFTATSASGESMLLNGSFEQRDATDRNYPRFWTGSLAQPGATATVPLAFVGEHRDGGTGGLMTGGGRSFAWRQTVRPTNTPKGRLALVAWVKAEGVKVRDGEYARLEAKFAFKDGSEPFTFTADIPPDTYDWRPLTTFCQVDQGRGSVERIDVAVTGRFSVGRIVVDKIDLSDDAAMSSAELLGRKIADLDAALDRAGDVDASVATARTHLRRGEKFLSDSSVDAAGKATESWIAGARAVSPAVWAKVFPEAVNGRRADEARMIFHGGQGMTKAEVDASLDRLQAAGANGTFHSAGSWLSVIYPSQLLPTDPAYAAFDSFGYAISAAKARGVTSFAYLATLAGVATPPTGEGSLFATHPNWFAKGPDPRMPTFPDPANLEVVEFVVRAYVELATKYDLDGIGLDYVRYPSETALNYDAINQAQIREKYGFDILVPGPNLAADTAKWANVREHRAAAITSLVRRVRDAVKAVRPKTLVVGCLLAEPDVAIEYGQDWRQLAPLFDVVVPMNYDDRSADAELLATQRSLIGGNTLFVPAVGGMPELHDAWPISRWAERLAAGRRAGADGVIVYRMGGLDPAVAAFLGNGPFHGNAAFPTTLPTSPAGN